MTRSRAASRPAVLFVTAVMAAVGGFFAGRASDDPSASAPAAEAAEAMLPVPVATAAVRRGRIEESAHAFGVVQTRPADAIVISVPFESVVGRVHVTAGESVPAGASLIDIDASPDARLQLTQADEAVAAAGRNVEQARRRRDEQLATNADVAAAEQALQIARTQQDAQRSRGVGAARTLRADMAGVVTAVSVQPGQTAAAATPLAVLAPHDSFEVRVGVDPADLDGVRPGTPVHLRPADQTGTLAGTVRQQGRQLNPQRLCDVFVRPDRPIGLLAGTFVEATFPRGRADGLVVPRAATQLEGDDWCVYSVKDDKAVRHTVTPGPSDGQDILIRGGGLAEGDRVVTRHDGELADGATVTADAAGEGRP